MDCIARCADLLGVPLLPGMFHGRDLSKAWATDKSSPRHLPLARTVTPKQITLRLGNRQRAASRRLGLARAGNRLAVRIGNLVARRITWAR
jgi:hypothetical protein